MKATDLFAENLAGNMEFIKSEIIDFSDADMFVRPAPTANHAAWQLGHLIASETKLINAVSPGAMPELPAGFSEKFTRETARIDDPKAFATKADLVQLFERARAASVKWAKSLTDEQLHRQTPEFMRSWVPTVMHLAAAIPNHVAMHVGQIQVIRRKLGKPILF
jgi:hypothetical protein